MKPFLCLLATLLLVPTLAKADCLSIENVEATVLAGEPSARFATLDEKQFTQLHAYLGHNFSEIDSIAIGNAPSKKTVLIMLFAKGCYVQAVYMNVSDFYQVMAPL